MREMRIFCDYEMENGEIFPREKVSELASEILAWFAIEELSVDEAKVVLQCAMDLVGQSSVVVRK